ncbi:MAG: hypothetical protein WBL40_23335, partial [Terrimicrobiaceae bacterium]
MNEQNTTPALIRLETLPCGADRLKFGAARLTERLERIRLQGSRDRANLFEQRLGEKYCSAIRLTTFSA